MNRPLALILVVGWSVLAALGVTYSLLVDFIALYHLGDGGPYGILFDYKHVTVLSAFPAQLMTTYAFMGIGRKAGIGIELLVTLALWFTAIGVWRSNRIATRFATSFFALQGAILIAWVGYIAPHLFKGPPDGLKLFSLAIGLVFIALYGTLTVYLSRLGIKEKGATL